MHINKSTNPNSSISQKYHDSVPFLLSLLLRSLSIPSSPLASVVVISAYMLSMLLSVFSKWQSEWFLKTLSDHFTSLYEILYISHCTKIRFKCLTFAYKTVPWPDSTCLSDFIFIPCCCIPATFAYFCFLNPLNLFQPLCFFSLELSLHPLIFSRLVPYHSDLNLNTTSSKRPSLTP